MILGHKSPRFTWGDEEKCLIALKESLLATWDIIFGCSRFAKSREKVLVWWRRTVIDWLAFNSRCKGQTCGTTWLSFSDVTPGNLTGAERSQVK